jgi:GNAT superfamily N-acetyltransferase
MHRRKGIGRALQEEALVITKELGCIQMRSWSSLDAMANYQLKLNLGFGFHPEIQETPSGLRVSGGYFVKRVD